MNRPAKQSLLAAYMLRPFHWDADAERWARLLPRDNPADYGELFRKQIEAGELSAFELLNPAGERRGILLASVCRIYSEPEFVVHGAYSDETKRDLVAEFREQIESLARLNGCRTMRFHTMRAGLIHKLMGHGYRVSEVIVRKDLAA